MTTTLGIDLAPEPAATTVCLVGWAAGGASVDVLAAGEHEGRALDDDHLLELLDAAAKAGLAAPFDAAGAADRGPGARCAQLLAALAGRRGAATASRDGSGLVVAVDPDAALAALTEGVAPRAAPPQDVVPSPLEALLAGLGPEFVVRPAHRALAAAEPAALRALTCALVARAARLGLTVPPPDVAALRQALVDGWTHAPVPGAVARLCAPAG
ncbi:DUF429 domain-containing protein [Conexibacter sp. SYSU D00693]|uniref:DUF429 domain-containing protein n=1 Tax=Conexibacter sp. SYSU D00693 TaxID=2812560 RepID=UPI00196ADCD6|nr:DUF429 domain-containing protein [Conexibacter sp. SYSU D00693]